MVDSKLIEKLRDANNQDNKEYVQSRIRSAKSAISTQAFNKMKTQWVQLVDKLHEAEIEEVKAILSALQIEVLLMLNDHEKIMSMCNMDTLDNLSKISERLKSVSLSVGELVPATESLKLQLTYEGKGSDAISDANLAGYIPQGKKTHLGYTSKRKVWCCIFLDIMKAASITQLLETPTYIH